LGGALVSIWAGRYSARSAVTSAMSDRDRANDSDNEEEKEDPTTHKSDEPKKGGQAGDAVTCDTNWLHELVQHHTDEWSDFHEFLSVNKKLLFDGQGRSDVNFDSLQDDWDAYCASNKDTETVKPGQSVNSEDRQIQGQLHQLLTLLGKTSPSHHL
jgi:hypothetical protein